MFKLVRKWWKYLTAKLTGDFNERADPKVQLEQAITEAQEQHRRTFAAHLQIDGRAGGANPAVLESGRTANSKRSAAATLRSSATRML